MILLLNSESIHMPRVHNDTAESPTNDGKVALCVLEWVGWEMGTLEMGQMTGHWGSGSFSLVSQH